jgi:hypothetical protein
MNIDPSLEAHVTRLFAPLNQQRAGGGFPITGALSSALNASVTPKSKAAYAVNISPTVATMFSAAGVNSWLRAVHSFLVSAALTDVSPIWASVAGYYSSHYSVRAIAHVLGFFQLFTAKQTVQIELQGNQFAGTFNPKKGSDREHKLYWKVVKTNPLFAADPFFTDNDASRDPSDAGHRERANYADFLPNFPTFAPLNRDEIIQRIQKISNIECSAPPIPSASRFPDIESVQVIAYHRLVRFRDLLDEVLGNGNRFWGVHRDPPWARGFIDYQLVDAQTNPVELGGK